MTYSVMLCDKSLPSDILIRICCDRDDARTLCRNLNAGVMAGWTEGTPQPPLYYVHYAEHARDELRKLRAEKRICEVCFLEFTPRMRRQRACGPKCSAIRTNLQSRDWQAKKRANAEV